MGKFKDKKWKKNKSINYGNNNTFGGLQEAHANSRMGRRKKGMERRWCVREGKEKGWGKREEKEVKNLKRGLKWGFHLELRAKSNLCRNQ